MLMRKGEFEMSRVGVKIKEARQKKGISAKQLSKKLGVAEKFILDVENGKKIMSQNLIERASKILGEDLNDLTMNYDESQSEEKKPTIKYNNNYNASTTEKVDTWENAFSSILRDVPVYDYSLSKIIGKRTLPLISNKIEGHAADKVLFLQVMDDDMFGFRIMKGDIAFGYKTSEIENNCFYLLEYKGERVLRQVKRLDNNKVLLISNTRGIFTQTAEVKSITPLVKLEKLEIKL